MTGDHRKDRRHQAAGRARRPLARPFRPGGAGPGAGRGLLRAFGLDVRADGNVARDPHRRLTHRWGTRGARARASAAPPLLRRCFEDDLEPFKRRIEEQGIALLDPPPGLRRNGLWLRDHDGTLIEIRVAREISPDAKIRGREFDLGAGRARPPRRSARRPAVRPRRLAHVLSLHARRAGRSRSTPRARPAAFRPLRRRIAFMHGIHGSDHHLMAFAKSNAPGLHHCSWDVGIDRRHRARRHAAWPTRASRGLGPRPPRARLELFPLRPRPVGQLLRIFLRHRLHPGRSDWEARRLPAGGLLLSLGSGAAVGLRPQLRGGGDTPEEVAGAV